MFDKNDKKKIGDWLGFIACMAIAIVCLVACYYHTVTILDLIKSGRMTAAIVIDIKTGTKNSKWPIYQFKNEAGEVITKKDIFQMYIYRLKKGEKISVIHDRINLNVITADIGWWKWQGTMIFGFGFVFLLALGILIRRHSLNLKREKDN